MSTRRHRVVVAGGGVGAVETVLALRALAGDRVALELVAPGDELVYRPLAVAEPFGYAEPLRLPLTRLADAHRVHLHRETLAAVDAPGQRVLLSDGATVGYDSLVVAIGGQPEPWLPGALTFGGEPADVRRMAALLDELAACAVTDVLFALPPGATWTLPLYELALLTSAWCGERKVAGVRLTLATPERSPLEAFGPAAARLVRDLLGDRGIELRTAVTAGAGGADRTVTLPRLRPRRIDGLPAGRDGFIPIDDFAAVDGLVGVYAVGDATSSAVKQGGLAAQQADAAASAIAAAAGAPVAPQPFAPVIRGLLLTGVASAYLRADPAAPDEPAAAAWHALWWPPTKIAGRYIAPYLAGEPAPAGTPELVDRRAHDPGDATARDDVRRLALSLAELDAGTGDHRSALRWLQTVEWLDGAPSAELAALRARYEEALHAHE